MTKIEELRKAIEEACGTGDALLKSQMGFDFGATTTPNPHHAAYARRNASGTVSQIQAKGAPPPEHHAMVKELHDAFERHDRRGRGGMGIGIEHPDYSTPDKYLQTAKNILMYQGHYRLGAKGRDEVTGILGRHIRQMEPQGHDEQPVTVQTANAGRTHAIPQRPTYPAPSSMTTADLHKIIESREAHTEDFIGDLKPGDKTELVWSSGRKQEITIKGSAAAPSPAVKSLIAQVEKAATNLLTNSAMEPHRPEVEQMISELHKFPSAGHASAIVGRLVDMGLEAQQAEPK